MYAVIRRLLPVVALTALLTSLVGCASPWGRTTAGPSSPAPASLAAAPEAPPQPSSGLAGNPANGTGTGRSSGLSGSGPSSGSSASDYQAMANGSRTLPQVDDEVRVAFGRVTGYRDLICLTEAERQHKAGI